MERKNVILILIVLLMASPIKEFNLTVNAQVHAHKAKHKKVKVKKHHTQYVEHRKISYNKHEINHHTTYPHHTLAAMPKGAAIVRKGSHVYRYHHGVYYHAQLTGYVAVMPVEGIVIGVLPVGYSTVIIDRKTYYTYKGIYYTPRTTNLGYVVINKPIGA